MKQATQHTFKLTADCGTCGTPAGTEFPETIIDTYCTGCGMPACYICGGVLTHNEQDTESGNFNSAHSICQNPNKSGCLVVMHGDEELKRFVHRKRADDELDYYQRNNPSIASVFTVEFLKYEQGNYSTRFRTIYTATRPNAVPRAFSSRHDAVRSGFKPLELTPVYFWTIFDRTTNTSYGERYETFELCREAIQKRCALQLRESVVQDLYQQLLNANETLLVSQPDLREALYNQACREYDESAASPAPAAPPASLEEWHGLALHIIALANDAYFTGHPEWETIVRDAVHLLPASACTCPPAPEPAPGKPVKALHSCPYCRALAAVGTKVPYDAGNHNGMPCEWTAFGDAAKPK